MKYGCVLLLMGVLVGVAVVSFAQGEDGGASGAWTPPADDRERFEPITRVNIFLSQRPRVVEVRPRQPDPEPDEPEAAPGPPPPPPDPDRHKVLVGVSLVGEGEERRPVMVIEDRATGRITRLTELGPFSRGEITEADLNGLTYTVGGEDRHIRVGQALTGQAPAPGSSPTPGSAPGSATGGGTAPGSAPGQADGTATDNPDESELLRRLRERREQEQ